MKEVSNENQGEIYEIKINPYDYYVIEKSKYLACNQN